MINSEKGPYHLSKLPKILRQKSSFFHSFPRCYTSRFARNPHEEEQDGIIHQWILSSRDHRKSSMLEFSPPKKNEFFRNRSSEKQKKSDFLERNSQDQTFASFCERWMQTFEVAVHLPDVKNVALPTSFWGGKKFHPPGGEIIFTPSSFWPKPLNPSSPGNGGVSLEMGGLVGWLIRNCGLITQMTQMT